METRMTGLGDSPFPESKAKLDFRSSCWLRSSRVGEKPRIATETE